MKRLALAAAGLLTAGVANAAAVETQVGTNGAFTVNPAQYASVAYSDNFESGGDAYFAASGIKSGNSSGNYSVPSNDTSAHYYVVGGSGAGTPYTFNTSGFSFNQLSFYWGSVDSFNTVAFYNAGGLVQSFSGSAFASSSSVSEYVSFFFSPSVSPITSVVFSTSQNAFEFDNLVIGTAVPEPSTWAMLIGGIGFTGGALRLRRREQRALRTA